MKSVIKFVCFILALFVLSCSSNDPEVTPAPIPNIPTSDDFIRAADMSYLPLIESEGTIYKKNGVAENAITTLKMQVAIPLGSEFGKIRLQLVQV